MQTTSKAKRKITIRIRQVALRRLVIWGISTLIILAVVLGMSIFHFRYIHNFINVPFEMSENALLGIRDLNSTPRIYVTISGSRTVDTGIQEITVEKQDGVEESRHVSGAYYALLVGGHWLVVKSDLGVRTSTEGTLEAMTPELYAELFATAEEKKTADEFYPFFVDATDLAIPWPAGRGFSISTFRLCGLSYIGLSIFFFGICAFVLHHEVRPILTWVREPMGHPVLQRIKKWGEPRSVSADIERELQYRVNFGSGRVLITDNYIIEKDKFYFNVLRLEDLLWAYKLAKWTRKGSKYYCAVLEFHGSSVQIPATEKEIESILLRAANKAPSAMSGYTPELFTQFKKHPQDFYAVIESRRQENQKQKQRT